MADHETELEWEIMELDTGTLNISLLQVHNGKWKNRNPLTQNFQSPSVPQLMKCQTAHVMSQSGDPCWGLLWLGACRG
jgi:hypothetical protein